MAENYFVTRIEKLAEALGVLKANDQLLKSLEAAGIMIADSLKINGSLYICGNGGSAADSQHIAAEFTGRFLRERAPLSAEALTTNTSTLTAIANDYGFDNVFKRQMEARAKDGDVLWGISTSGNSLNVMLAMRKARQMGVRTIGLSGAREGTDLEGVSDVFIPVASTETPRIQEMHILVGHMLCEFVDDRLFG